MTTTDIKLIEADNTKTSKEKEKDKSDFRLYKYVHDKLNVKQRFEKYAEWKLHNMPALKAKISDIKMTLKKTKLSKDEKSELRAEVKKLEKSIKHENPLYVSNKLLNNIISDNISLCIPDTEKRRIFEKFDRYKPQDRLELRERIEHVADSKPKAIKDAGLKRFVLWTDKRPDNTYIYDYSTYAENDVRSYFKREHSRSERNSKVRIARINNTNLSERKKQFYINIINHYKVCMSNDLELANRLISHEKKALTND